jgi:protein-S-isoprenylcysteine O-methyltransferase Ste14
MLALVGSILNFGHFRSLVAATMVTVAWVYKSGVEEEFMAEHFGREYDRYRAEVRRLIPMVW